MRAKRIISLIAIVVFASTAFFVPAAFAEEANLSVDREKLMIAAGEIAPPQVNEESVKIKKDEAIKIARGILEDGAGLESSNVNLNPGYGGMKGVWNINFYSKSNPSVNINVNIDADTGDIIGYNKWSGVNSQQNYVAKFTRTEALAPANAFLKDRLKFGAAEYELQPANPYDYYYSMGGVKQPFSYTFYYMRKLNGVLLPADTVYISVDGTSGEVTSFNRNPAIIDMSKLPSAGDVLPPDKIIPVYRASVDLDLQYITQLQGDLYGTSRSKVMLAYVPIYSSDLIDAKKGVQVNYDGVQTVAGNPDRPAVNTAPINTEAVLPPAAAKTEAEAGVIAENYRKSIEKLFGIKFDDNTSARQEYFSQNDAWYFNWNKSSGNINYYAYLAISKTTGRITSLNFNKYDNSYDMMMSSGQKMPEVKAGLTWDAGKKKALETVEQLLPDQYGFFADQNVKEPEITAEVSKTLREYSYSFTRVANGLLFRDNTMNLSIDRETGEIRNFYMSWTDAEFPKTEAVITKDAAVAKYFEGMEPRLQYMQKISYDQQTQMVKYDPVPFLVYTFLRNGTTIGGTYIDAANGKLVDYSGREIKPGASSSEPIPGDSWAKRSVELLTAQGIIKDPYIGYDSELTRAEAVKMLSIAKGIQYYYDYSQFTGQSFKDVPRDSEYFIYVENAVNQGIIAKGAEFKGDGKVTREEYAKFLVNLTGYAELAAKPNIFKTEGLKVSNPANAGYVAICSAFDFLPVKPGETFDGSGNVTLAEAAVALYKALSYVR